MRRSLLLGLICMMTVLYAYPQFTLSGKVTDKQGDPVAYANVIIRDSYSGTYTGKDGGFQIKNLKKGSYVVEVSFIGFNKVEQVIELISDIELSFTLEESLILSDEVLVQATKVQNNTPATYSNVLKEDFEKNNCGQDIPYLLSLTPSLITSSDAGTGVGYTSINIRGADVKRINVTVNGIPVNDAESHGVWWVDLPDIASSTESIQVQRGVGTSTNGAGAFGATINFMTTSPGKDPYAEMHSSYGSYNTSKNTVNAGTGLINNKFGIDTRFSKIWSDGYINRAFADMRSFFISGTYYGKNSLLKFVTFSGEEHTYQAWYGVPQVKLRGDSAGMANYVNTMASWGEIYGDQNDMNNMFNSDDRTYCLYNYNNQTDNYLQNNYQLLYSKDIGKGLNLNLALHYTKGKGYYECLNPNGGFADYNVPDAVINNDTIYSTDFITQKWLNNDFYGFTYSLNYRKNRMNTILGGGWNEYKGQHYGDIIWARIVTFTGEKYRWYSGDGDKKDFNVFLKTSYLLTGNLNLYADLQARSIDYTISGVDDNQKEVNQHHDYFFFNPKAGLLYDVNEKQKAYVSFGIAQREPDRSNFTDADQGRIPGPEKLYDIEAGYEYRSSDLLIRGNIFHMMYTDQLIQTGEINSVGAAVMTNVKNSYRQGVELEGGVRILKNLRWNMNLLFSRNIIPADTFKVDNWDTWGQEDTVLKDMTISFSPGVVFNNVIQFEPVKNLNISLVSKFVGKQYTDNTTNSDFMSKLFPDSSYKDDRFINQYFVNNLTFDYTIKGKSFREISLHFSVNNLFDTKYETYAWVYSYIYNNRFNVVDGYFPQAGRNFMAGISLKF